MHRRISILFMLSLLPALLLMPISSQTYTLYILFTSWDGSSWSTPTQIVEIDYANATRDSFQRKVWISDDGYYFVTYYNHSSHQTKYVASSDGDSWSAPITLDLFGVFPLSNIDVEYPALDHYYDVHEGILTFSGSRGAASYYSRFNCTDATLEEFVGGSVAAQNATGGSIVSSLGGDYAYYVYHSNRTSAPIHNNTVLTRGYANSADTDNSMNYLDGVAVANQLLKYKTSSPYHMLVISKMGNQSFAYNLINATSRDFEYDAFQSVGIVGGHSKNDFCAVSEAQAISDPEIVHLVFGNSSGLFYMKFESDAWNIPAALGVSGSYITLNLDASGNLLLTYALGNTLYYMLKAPAGSWGIPQVLTSAYISPAYCSSNHNEQAGEICLVFTGTLETATAQSTISEYLGVAAALILVALSLIMLSL